MDITYADYVKDAKGRDVVIGTHVADSYGRVHVVVDITDGGSCRYRCLVLDDGRTAFPWLVMVVPSGI